jgi:tRNA (guanine37-N1)-methyltransferase
VVNKTEALENIYRNPTLEVLAGNPSLITKVKEGDCFFNLDFGTVYWNSRLNTERERVKLLLLIIINKISFFKIFEDD